MDPLSIAAFVVTIVHVTGKLSDGVGRFCNDQRTVPAAISEFQETIQNLHAALLNIARVLDHHPANPLPSEKEHNRDIHRILKSCKVALERLRDELPELAENPGPMERAKSALSMSLKRNVIRGLLSNISSYTQVLQLSLITLSLGSMRTQQQSQEQIHHEIRKLTDAIRSSTLISRNHNNERRPSTIWDDDDTRIDDTEALTREIEAWRLSADGVAAAITLQETDRQKSEMSLSSLLSRSSPGSTTALSAGVEKTDRESDDWDPEPELQEQQIGPGREILLHQYRANQDIVEQLVKCGIFLRASFFQKRGIELREQLMRPGYDFEFHFHERALMKEKLADILLFCETDEGTREAKTTLQDIMDEELKQPEGERDGERISRLYHKLGDVHIKLGDPTRAKKFLSRALGRRQSIQPIDLALETAELYETVLQLNGEFDEARGVRNWIEEIRPSASTTLLEPEYGELCSWCKAKGFDIDAVNFRFDECDRNLDKSPLHEAVQEEEVPILEKMAKHVVNFECGSDEGIPTPLLLAASTRNSASVAVLLQHGAHVDVRDGAGMTPLHRCQKQSGGVQVAQQLIERCPSIINEVDKSGRTALFKACEFGNDKMVTFLLEKGADPNICQKRQGDAELRSGNVSTPLIAAIEGAIKRPRQISIVEALLLNGANPRLTDADGRNASAWAVNRGLVGSEIRTLLQRYAPDRRMSSLSSTTVATRASQSSDPGSSRRVLGRIWSRSDPRRASSESTPL